MYELNADYLDDERTNLNIQLSQPILVIADLGRWNGRVMGYKEIPSGNIQDCLYSDTDYSTWYMDKLGDLRCDAVHHDGVATRADITRLTRRLGDEIARVYGWEIPNPKVKQKEAR